MSLPEIVKAIKSLNVKTQTVYKIFEKQKQENTELKISLRRLHTQIQKQS